MIELFEHTADIGLRVGAHSFEALCERAAAALTALLVGAPDAIEAREREVIVVSDDDDAYLLVDWLSELLYRFHGEKRVFGRFAVRRSEEGLSASIEGERYDLDRHGQGREVKAITYHGLLVEQQGEQWVAEVIVDV